MYQRGLVPTEATIIYHRQQHIVSKILELHIGAFSLFYFDSYQNK